ncbi:hypothetical protein NIES2100_29850 [Calothrix sp. NIES-2100]|uniref:hypothetical protein n=1 Tax=Calothrix sp. NIES-2100 TaxID=1954172 RepID=UPI000B5EE549|nr:hypothetical protein NIES2100_29850 [Calothrix sp. NIES-2100]
MLEYPSISKRHPEFPDYLNFQTLRDIGINHLQALSGKIWTDYNLHDPGVTILEVLCYAVTDLGYRNNLDIEDLLALNPADSQQQENNFFTPDEILTCNPVTDLDLRKRLIDIPGVRNAWVEKFTEEVVKETTEAATKKVSTYHPPIYIDYVNSKLLHNPPNDETEENAPRLHPRGLYTVYIDIDWKYRRNACGQIYLSCSDTLDQVKAVLCHYRNLCEDVYDIVVLGEEEIALCSDIELETDADAEDVLVEIYVRIQAFLSPRLRFYTLQELLDKGKSIAEIFAGRPSFLHSQKIQRQLIKRESKVNNESKIYYKYKLISQHKLPLLEAAIDYEDETKASAAFDELLTLSRNLSNYQLIDNAEGNNHYSFALYKEIKLLASHPQVYATAMERNQALYSLIDAVNADEDYNSHGFIDTAELKALTLSPMIYTSDLYQEILKIPGVAAVRRLSIANYINGLPQSQSSWHLQLTKGYSPVLGIEQSKITLFKGMLPIPADGNEVKRRYYEQQAAHIKVFRQDNELDLSVPNGSYYNLSDHYSIQHDFPLTYGIGEDGLPQTATVLRKAQARQLKGYLVFFDQLLANYLVQLAHVRDLFSWEVDETQERENDHMNRPKEKGHTYFTQLLDFPGFAQIMDFPGLEEILKNPKLDVNDPKSEEIVPALREYRKFLNSITEEPQTYSDRRNRFLDHLLGRFAESFADYVLINYRIIQERQGTVKDEVKVIHDKAQFLQDYPTLSRDRFRAFNYCKQVWDTENVSGFQKRASRLLGFEDVRRRNLCHYRVIDTGNSTFVGQIYDNNQQSLLQSLQSEDSLEKAWQHGNILLEMAQNQDNFRLIDGDNGRYGWKLTTKGQEPILATQYYASKSDRDEAITAIQACINDEGFHVLEHILLRPQKNLSVSISGELTTPTENFLPIFVTADDAPKPGEEQPNLTWQDPYSFWISIILPYWPKRFRNLDFRRFVERTLRLEAPAHIALKIAWLDMHQMSQFEEAYHKWLEQLALDACYGSACDLTGALNDLLAIIPQLRSIYPKGILYDNSQASNPPNQPIILNQTALGTAND